MSFSRFVCWKHEQLPTVMQTDVEYQASSAIFAATHYPLRMYKRHSLDVSGARLPYDEQTFKREFLDENKPYMFVPVLGEAGSGKSHLLRWLESTIPARSDRRVLLIPKVHTNLREILLQILSLDGLSGEPFFSFRRRVEESSAHLTLSRAKEELLLNLAVAVGPEGEHKRVTLTEQERFLANNLPNLLKDPFFAAHLLADNGVIHSLAVQSIGMRTAAERLEERQQFKAEDLPLNLKSAREASLLARKAWDALIINKELVPPALAWLNEHIDQAVMRVFSMGGRDLVRIMREVRTALGEKTELIILIEDFMLLQAIDRQLLESLLVRPTLQDGTKLCRMRVALACTSGYFRDLADTVRTRTDFYVDMDIDVRTGVKDISATLITSLDH